MAERTAPWLIAYLLDAAGLVLIRGGVLSHAAAMCRELDIPCLVGIDESFAARLPNTVVELNANQGYLRILGT
jgi:phosphoenolpyruvate-protein kinase (PTS system EI component)